MTLRRWSRRAPSACGWLKQLDRVAGWIVEQNLLPTRTGDHVVPEAHARPSQPGDFGIDVVDKQVNAIPPAWARLSAVGHGSSSRAGRAAEQQPQIAAFYVGERWRKVGQNSEPEMGRVKVHGGLDVVD